MFIIYTGIYGFNKFEAVWSVLRLENFEYYMLFTS